MFQNIELSSLPTALIKVGDILSMISDVETEPDMLSVAKQADVQILEDVTRILQNENKILLKSAPKKDQVINRIFLYINFFYQIWNEPFIES